MKWTGEESTTWGDVAARTRQWSLHGAYLASGRYRWRKCEALDRNKYSYCVLGLKKNYNLKWNIWIRHH